MVGDVEEADEGREDESLDEDEHQDDEIHDLAQEDALRGSFAARTTRIGFWN